MTSPDPPDSLRTEALTTDTVPGAVPDEGRAPPETLGALFVGSAAILALEIAQVRIFSYAIDPLLVFSAISVALLGLGAGGIAVALRPELARGDARPRMAASLALFALTTLFSHAAFARVSHRVGFGTASGVLLAAAPVLAMLLVPYFFGGVFLSVALTRHVRDASRAYFVNLAGSALGCVALYPLLRPFGVEPVVAGIAAAAAWAALASVARGRTVTPRARAALLALALCASGLVPFAARVFPFRPDPGDLYGMARTALRRAYPGRDERAYTPVREFAQWDPVSRIEVYAFPGEFGRINGVAPMRLFAQDGGAGSLLVDLRGQDTLRRSFFEATIWAGPYFLRPRPARVLAIGLGGGPDIMSALYHGAGQITGVEINASAIDLVRGPYASFLGDPYGARNVEIIHRDGRGFIERTRERYDVIQLTGADTYSAGAAGAFMFSESYLYTVEAFQRYIRALEPEGVLSVTRFGAEALRVITSEFAAMRALGIAHPEDHIVLLGQGISVNVMLSRRALTRQDAFGLILAVRAASANTPRIRIPVYEAMGFGIADPLSVLYVPGGAPANPYAQMVAAEAAGRGPEVLARSQWDLRPVGDDRPFFFQFVRLRPSAIFAAREDDFYARGFRAHVTFLGAIAAAALALIVLPLGVARRRALPAGASARTLAYFAVLGVAYLLVELTLMQKSALFLGHPTYGVAVTLLALLLSSGLGSAIASRRGTARRTAATAAIATALLLGVAQYALPRLFVALLPSPLAVRAAALAIAITPLGFAMGIPFPAGLRAAASRGETLVAWGLGVNSFASVIASLVAVPMAMYGGFSLVVAVAAVLYLAAAAIAPRGA